jgi:protein-tyrosine kinase
MDRISKALELTRQARRPLAAQRRLAPNTPIKYTQTKKVYINPDVLRKHKIISAIDDRVVIDSYKLLRTRLMARMQQHGWTTLGVTSCGANEGKSLTSINLAVSIALKYNQTVLLVDADLRRPSTHNFFGIEVEYGLSDYLLSEKPIEEILIHPEIERLVILPGNGRNLESVDHSSELLASPQMANLVFELKTRYPSRMVLFDLPPVLVGDDVVAFASHLDTMMLVIEDGKTNSDEFEHAIELLKDIELVGTVLNKSCDHSKEYGYYY